MLDPKTGEWLENITCRKCRRRHPEQWSCQTAMDIASAQRKLPVEPMKSEGTRSIRIKARDLRPGHIVVKRASYGVEVMAQVQRIKLKRGLISYFLLGASFAHWIRPDDDIDVLPPVGTDESIALKARCWDTLLELAGDVNADSNETVSLVQERRTGSRMVKVGYDLYGQDKSDFVSALNDAAEKRGTENRP